MIVSTSLGAAAGGFTIALIVSAAVPATAMADQAVFSVKQSMSGLDRSDAQWGDFDNDGSGQVDFGDLLAVLSNWGPCVE